jgi:hypothetical protein
MTTDLSFKQLIVIVSTPEMINHGSLSPLQSATPSEEYQKRNLMKLLLPETIL